MRSTRSKSKSKSKSRSKTYRKHRQQRGGMAPFVAGSSSPDYLLVGPARVQAEVAPLDRYVAELPSVIQRGGTRYRGRRRGGKSKKHQRRRQQRGGMAPVSQSDMLLSSEMYKSANLPNVQGMIPVVRAQKGGMAPFVTGKTPDFLLPGGVVAGVNRQFMTEGSVNPLYGQMKGAQ